MACGIVAWIPSGKRPGSLAAGLNGEIAVFHPAMLPVDVSHHSMGFERLGYYVHKRIFAWVKWLNAWGLRG